MAVEVSFVGYLVSRSTVSPCTPRLASGRQTIVQPSKALIEGVQAAWCENRRSPE